MTEKQQTMLNWIQNTMRYNEWYPVKSDEAFETIEYLFENDLIEECEMNDLYTHIRKVDIAMIKKETIKFGNNEKK
jgi:hypothetical protein